jgi:adenylylsulfate kinase
MGTGEFIIMIYEYYQTKSRRFMSGLSEVYVHDRPTQQACNQFCNAFPETHVDYSATVFWMTGLSGAGKTTLAHAAARNLASAGHAVQVFDGDELRQTISQDLGFSHADRAEHIYRVARLVENTAKRGIISICSLITPTEAHREIVQTILPQANVVYVACSLQLCEQRDVKGLYATVRSGKITDYTGVSAPFEIPRSPDCTLETVFESVETSCARLEKYILSRAIL